MTTLFSPARKHRRLFEREHDDPTILTLRLDNTGLQCIQHCPTAALNELVYGRTSIGRAPLDYGAALHKALEHWQQHVDKDAALQHLADYWETLPKYDMRWRTLSQAAETFSAYVDLYKRPFTLYKHNDRHWLEEAFDLPVLDIDDPFMLRGYPEHLIIAGSTSEVTDIPVSTIKLRWTGKIDLLASIDNEPVLVDHKTCSVDSSTYHDSFINAAQFSGYTWAAHQLGLTQLRKVLINTLITRQPTGTGCAIDFARRTYDRYSWQITEWLSDVEAAVHLFLDQLKRGSFTRNTGNCAGKYGRCSFFDVCLITPSLRHQALAANGLYADRTWSPLNED